MSIEEQCMWLGARKVEICDLFKIPVQSLAVYFYVLYVYVVS